MINFIYKCKWFISCLFLPLFSLPLLIVSFGILFIWLGLPDDPAFLFGSALGFCFWILSWPTLLRLVDKYRDF